MSDVQCRYIIQIPSSLRCGFFHPLLGLLLLRRISPDLQSHHWFIQRLPIYHCLRHHWENVAAYKQLLHILSHEIPVSVSPSSLTLSCPVTHFYCRQTYDPAIDTFHTDDIIVPCLALALIFNYQFVVHEIFWSFSIILEAFAVLPQLSMIQQTGEADTIIMYYLATLGAYRGCYCLNWICRCDLRLS